MAVSKPSLPDAEPLKYIPQHLVRRDLSDNVREVVDAFSQVLGDEVSGKVGG